MDQLKNILVAVDFSPCSAAALKQAARIAALSRARVKALNVVPLPIYAVPDGTFMPLELPPIDLLLSSARESWNTWRPAREAGPTVDFDAALGIPTLEICDQVARTPFDLLVLGAHGQFDSSRALGSIAAGCVQRARASVMVVREGQTWPFRSVLACIDFSPTSLIALEQAIRIASLDGAALHILHVYTDPWHGVSPPDALKTNMPDFAKRYRQGVERHLRSFCEPQAHELLALGAKYHAHLAGSHGKGIVDVVHRQACDLVVLGTRSKWNFRDLFWGSTAERVVRETPSSALTVKPPL